MKEESHPPGSGWLVETVSEIDTDNIDDADHCAKPNRDNPLTHRSRVAEERIERLGLQPAGSGKLALVRNAIITDTMLAHAAGRRVSYSRNNNWYAQTARYRHPAFTRGTIFSTVNELGPDGYGLIIEDRAFPGDHLRTGLQSSFRASPKLVELWGPMDAAFTYDPHEPIRLKDGAGDLIKYGESNERIRWRNDMRAINEVLASADIVLDAPDVEWNPTLVRVPTDDSELIVLPWHKAAYRVFNGGWNLGGRLYGPFFQGLPKERRAQLRINGAPVVEHDYSQLHARLLYAEFGLEVEGDAYTVPGHEQRRPLFKVAWQIMINASDRRQGMYALAIKLAEEALRKDGKPKGEAKALAPHKARRFLHEASTILALLEERHQAVSAAFYTGAGLRLQRTDSDMCIRVLKQANKAGIIAGSVHDSFLAEEGRNGGRVQEFMADELARVTNTPKPCPVRLPADPVLQMVERNEREKKTGARRPGPRPPARLPAYPEPL
jgi:hypothetical protein